MFCSSCGTANAETETVCLACGASLPRKPHWMKWWLLLAVFTAFAAVVFAIYNYRSTQEFEITGELLYKNEQSDVPDVRPVAGARIEVFEAKGTRSDWRKYQLLLWRQGRLRMGRYHTGDDTTFAALDFVPLSKIDSWSWWEIERLKSCRWAGQVFRGALRSEIPIMTTYTNMSGHFWLKLRRGKYFVTADAEVPSFFRLENDPVHSPDTSTPVTGGAFWLIEITVTGNMKVVSAEASCSP